VVQKSAKLGSSESSAENSTDAEMVLWFALRDRRFGGFKFVRQEAIGNYVVDFVCRDRMIIVEVDGGQHLDNLRDVRRDARLNADGYRVLRFWNTDVLKNKSGVLKTILDALTPSGPILTFAPFSAGALANVRIKGPLANISF
jgi:very-short-patch-repair endonuclease